MDYDFNYYSGVDLVAPSRPKKPSLGAYHSSTSAREYADKLDVYEVEKTAYDKEYAVYKSKYSERMGEFIKTLQNDYNLTDNLFKIIWDKAYEDGHSAGLQEVFYYFDELYDFIQKYMNEHNKEN